MATVIVFSDVNPDVGDDGPYELAYNESSINKSLETIFTTPINSRVFRRQFGIGLLNLLFEPITERTAALVGYELQQAAARWENRITNVKAEVIPDYTNQMYYVDVTYTIPRLGDKMVSYKFNLSKG